MKILVVGDIHGNEKILPRLDLCAEIHKCDLIFQLGDFGFFPVKGVLFPVQYKMKTPLYWIDGNHEHFDLLETYNRAEYIKRTNCTHVPRGTVMKWGGLNFLCIGGASSIDKFARKEGVDWFPQENITEADIQKCLNQSTPIDVVFAHETHSQAIPKADIFWDPPGMLNREKLYDLYCKVKGAYWINGHWHVRKRVGERHFILNDPAYDSAVIILNCDKPEDPISLVGLPLLET